MHHFMLGMAPRNRSLAAGEVVEGRKSAAESINDFRAERSSIWTGIPHGLDIGLAPSSSPC